MTDRVTDVQYFQRPPAIRRRLEAWTLFGNLPHISEPTKFRGYF